MESISIIPLLRNLQTNAAGYFSPLTGQHSDFIEGYLIAIQNAIELAELITEARYDLPALAKAYSDILRTLRAIHEERAPMEQVGREILEIMSVYHKQEQEPSGIGTPGGLEHMGDVWRLLARWEAKLKAPCRHQEGK